MQAIFTGTFCRASRIKKMFSEMNLEGLPANAYIAPRKLPSGAHILLQVP